MRKIVMAAAMLLAVPAMVDAQNTVQATAQIQATSSVTGSGDVAFGTLSGGDVTINAAGGANAALRTVNYNHNINVSFTGVPATLVSGGNSLAVSLTCASQVGGVWSVPAPCSSTDYDLNVGASETSSMLGFGGTITGAAYAGAPAGTYTGSFTITIVAQ